jgi:hypothetical protein
MVEDYLSQMFHFPGNAVAGAARATAHPLDAAKGYASTNQDLLNRSHEALSRGDYPSAVRHAVSYFLNGIPGVGEAIDRAGDKAANGNVRGAITDAAALASQLAIGARAGGAVDAAAEVVPRPLRPRQA